MGVGERMTEMRGHEWIWGASPSKCQSTNKNIFGHAQAAVCNLAPSKDRKLHKFFFGGLATEVPKNLTGSYRVELMLMHKQH
jgi:hypothetical protein